MEQIALHTRFAGLSSTLIGDALDRLVGMRGLTRFDTGGAMVGPALTVRTRPGDNLALLAAIQGASSGAILVVDAGGDEAVAVAGELLMAYALRRGIRGLVVDGAIRDSDAFRAQGRFACFARAVSLRGPSKTGPGAVNVPVSVAGQQVHPGDLVFGDADGVIAVPRERLSEVVAIAERCKEGEARMLAALRGDDPDPLQVARLLAQAPGQVTGHA